MEETISGNIAVVTGAGSGIGRAICIKLSCMGARVYITDRDLKSAEQTLSLLEKANNSEALLMDVTKRESVNNAIDYIGQKNGRIDILVNNAGVSTMKSFEDLTEEEWDFNFNVNIKGMFLCSQTAIKYMKKNGGRIVNTASMAAIKGVPYLAHYAASKWAVLGFTKSLALELAGYGINVNSVCPGYVKTSMQERELVWESKLRGMSVEEIREEYIRLTPLKKLCLPEYIADAVGFLVSPQSSFMTGEELVITGGADLL